MPGSVRRLEAGTTQCSCPLQGAGGVQCSHPSQGAHTQTPPFPIQETTGVQENLVQVSCDLNYWSCDEAGQLHTAFYDIVPATCFLSQHARFVFLSPSPGGLAPAVRVQHHVPGVRSSRVHNHFCVQNPNVSECAVVNNAAVPDPLYSVQACIPEASGEEVSPHDEFHSDTSGKI